MFTNAIRSANYSSAVASMTLEKGYALPKVGDILKSGDSEARVVSVDKEKREVKLLVTKFPDTESELLKFREIAWDCMYLLGDKLATRDNKKWKELNSDEQSVYLESSLDILLMLQDNNLLRFSPFLIETE